MSAPRKRRKEADSGAAPKRNTAGAKPALVGIPEPDPERLEAATELSKRAPEPARVKNMLSGTAGWTDRTLIQSGLFYPPGTKSPRDRLAYYASHFPVVEVDATYYALMPPETAQRWAENTPDHFRFDVKAHPIVTGHPVDLARLPLDLKQEFERLGQTRRVYPERMPEALRVEIETRFAKSLDPLLAAGKLASLFVQFPPWFTATRGNVQRIEALAERWAGVPMAIEFRHTSWMLPERRERVLELLRRLELAYVCVDEPQVEGSVPPLVAATSSALAVIRFHGHNARGWQLKGASVYQRFDWLYTPDELAAWVQPVHELSRQAEEVHALFNNCVRNYSVINAKGLSALLESAPA